MNTITLYFFNKDIIKPRLIYAPNDPWYILTYERELDKTIKRVGVNYAIG